MLSTVPAKGFGADAGHDLGAVADADRREVRAEDLRHDPDARQVGDREARRRAGREQLPGRDQFLRDGARDRRADQSLEARQRPAGLDILDGRGGDLECHERLQCGVAVRLGADGVGLGLVGLALRDTVVLEQVLVEVGEPAGRRRGAERLAVGAHRGGEVGRGDHGQRLAGRDAGAERHEHPRHGTGERREDARRLVVVEVDSAARVDGAAVRRRLDGVEPDALALRGRERHGARRPRRRRRGVGHLGRAAGERECGNQRRERGAERARPCASTRCG